MSDVTVVLNATAMALYQWMAVDFDEARELPSIRALNAAWKAKAIAYNDSQDGNKGVLTEGWDLRDDSLVLSHETHQDGHRFIVAGSNDSVFIYLMADPDSLESTGMLKFINGRWEMGEGGFPVGCSFFKRLDHYLSGTVSRGLERQARDNRDHE